MKSLFSLFLIYSVIIYAQPQINFEDLVIKAELNPKLHQLVRVEAQKQNLPVSIYIPGKALIEAKDIENGRIVYSVITNFIHPSKSGFTAFYEDVLKKFDLSKARIIYADKKVIDNTSEKLQLYQATSNKLLLVPCWTYDRVMAFDFNTGNLVDTAFIPPDAPRLQSPKHAIQRSKSEILVSDQISDVVQMYDTTGIFQRTFAPAGGVNNSILDNIRGIAFKPNGNLLVTNASGSSMNRIQEFDTAGVFIGSFISTNVNSPFSILYRENDILIGNSSGTDKILRFTFDGNFISSFTTTPLNFIQQLIKNPNGQIVACEFSGTGTGLKIFDSTGVLITTLSGVTGNRGVFRLENGNYLTTNSAGLHEVHGTTGALIRSIYLGGSLQYIDVFDKSTGNLLNASLNFNSGWNLFSVPLTMSDMSVNQITPNRASNVFHYNLRYYMVDTLINGQAYWVKYNSDTTISISGTLPSENSIPVNTGWNLIGPFNSIVPVSSITSNPPDIIMSLFYGFNNGYFPANELLPNKGYWVRVSQSGNLIIPTTILKSSINNDLINTMNQFGRIIITDNHSNKANLYVCFNSINNSIYQLPPIPPSEVFDVRFLTNNLVENLESSKIISINGASYPITISVKGVSLEIKDVLDGNILYKILKEGDNLTISNEEIRHLSVRIADVNDKIQIKSNYPNPFNNSTTITFYLPETQFVELKLFDALGREVKTLLSETRTKGTQSVLFNGDELSSGIYFLILKSGDFKASRKILLMK